MVLDIIPANANRESRANEAALTQVMPIANSPMEWGAMVAALAII